MKKYLWDYGYLLSIAGAILIADQFTKTLVRMNLDQHESWMPWSWLEPYLRIVNWKNTGAALGMLQDFGSVFAVLSIIVSLAILYYFPRIPREDWPLRIALGLQLGGALGNLIDRLTQGYVTDFISFWNLTVFNLADLSITTGVIVLGIGAIVKERRDQQARLDLEKSQAPVGATAATPTLDDPPDGQNAALDSQNTEIPNPETVDAGLSEEDQPHE